MMKPVKNYKNIKYLFISLHGILGKSKIFQNEENILFSSHIQDGMGVTLGLKAGIIIVVVYDIYYPSSLRRAKELKTIEQLFINNKPETYYKYLDKFNIKKNEIAWMAYDIDLLRFFKKAEIRITVPEAPEELKKISHVITKKSGGRGALREAIELIIKKQGQWEKVINDFEFM